MARKPHRRPRLMPVWLVALIHVAALGLALVLYALPHHVIPRVEAAVGIVSSRGGGAAVASMPAQQASYSADSEAEAAYDTAWESGDEDPWEDGDDTSVEDLLTEADFGEDLASDDAPESDGGDLIAYADASEDPAGDGAAIGADLPEDVSPDAAAAIHDDPWGDAIVIDIPLPEGEEAGEEDDALQSVSAATEPPRIMEGAASVMPDEVGNFRAAMGDVFTDGEVISSKNSYRSANLSITRRKKFWDDAGAWVFVADIRIADISCLKTVFSKDTYGRGYVEWITSVAKRTRSVLTLNGDYYGSRPSGVIIRNGILYRNKVGRGDICVLYWDGHMETIKGSEFDTMAEMNRGAYQSWCFGPSLLDGFGQPLKSFNCDSNLRKNNPRSAIGYFEPGHYCFVAVDGRNENSDGASMSELAGIMSALGCRVAYNLDGGQTSLFAAGKKLINHPSDGGRSSSDYIIIVDQVSQ